MKFIAEKSPYRTAINFFCLRFYDERNSNDKFLRQTASCSGNSYLLVETIFLQGFWIF